MKQKNYICFNDYPQDIQQKAMQIINERNPLDKFKNFPKKVQEEAKEALKGKPKNAIKYFKDVISQGHIGDENAIELILLSIGSLFIENSKPVHQQIKGSICTGKTSLLQKTLKIVPKRYLHIINNITPEYLYFIKDSLNPDYNIFLLDDINLTPATTAMLKTLTDNETPNKIFIENQNIEIKLPGKNLFFCIFSQEKNHDNVLETSLLVNNVNTELKHNQKVSRKIVKDSAEGYGINNINIKDKYLLANAIFEKLVEKPVKIFNYELNNIYDQYGLYTGYQQFNQLQNIVELAKARTFYYPKQREHVNNIILGTTHDMTYTIALLRKKELLKEFNLNKNEKELILTVYSYDDDLHEHAIGLYEKNSNSFKGLDVHTYSYIAQKLGISKDQLVKWVTGRGTGKRLGLEEIGLIKTVKINPNNVTSPTILYLDPKARPVQELLSKKKNSKLDKEDVSFNLAQDTATKSSLLDSFSRVENKRKCEPKDKYKKINSVFSTLYILNTPYTVYSYKELATYLQKYKEYIKKHCK